MNSIRRIVTNGHLFVIEELVDKMTFWGSSKTEKEWVTVGDIGHVYYNTREEAQKRMDVLNTKHEWRPC